MMGEEAWQREFCIAAKLLSWAELRKFVQEHVRGQLEELQLLHPQERPKAFRALLAEWHPDKCPAIADLATEIFQQLQKEKTAVLDSPWVLS